VTRSVDARSDSPAEYTGGEAASAGGPALMRPRPSNLAEHRDRRGQRRVLLQRTAPASELPPPVGAATRAPAGAKLRLMLHPIRRAAALSAVLARPAGYPDLVTLLLGGGEELRAYGEDRYDDVDLEWTADLLSKEIRLDSKESWCGPRFDPTTLHQEVGASRHDFLDHRIARHARGLRRQQSVC